MKRNTFLGATVVLLVGGMGAVLAQNPHFLSASATRQGDNLIVTFREVGLGNNQSISVEASALATAEYWCINRGGKNPSAANKRTIQSLETTSGQFTADKNGSVRGTLTITPPEVDFCSRGQTPVLQSVTYSDVSVTDVTNGSSITVPGTF